MILDEIVLHNVGAFRGRHAALLTPPSKRKPIILIGGLNGAGKTTLLESLQLALYGKLSSAGRMSGRSYEEYLRRLINHHALPRDGASVELCFRVHEEGEEREYRIKRFWHETKASRIQESVEVHIDGHFDQVVSDTWQERVGRFIPHQMAHLFFFDGDRIEALADPAQSADLLRSAIDALLGVDLVDQLSGDMKALQRRVVKEQAEGPARQVLEEAEAQLRDLERQMETLQGERAGHQTSLDRAKNQLELLNKTFREQGGELAERQAELESQQKNVLRERDNLTAQLLDLAAQDLPLAMAMPLLRSALEQGTKESSQVQAVQIQDTLRRRMGGVAEKLKKQGLSAQVIQLIEREILAAMAVEKKEGDAPPYLFLSPAGEARLRVLLDGILEDQKKAAQKLVEQYRSCEIILEQLDRMLAAVPDKGSLAKLAEEREALKQKITDDTMRLALNDAKQADIGAQRDKARQKWDRLHEAQRAAAVENEDLNRINLHADKIRNVLAKFRSRVTERHTRNLERLILESFQSLLHKKSLVRSIKIDPTTCTVTLQNTNHQEISPERLSMGERQLLSVAMLWGMARASGRPLPVIIDTPLGRLDSEHRTNLVERYFPKASHQVLLLSTDEEIDPRYHGRMKDHIGHTYRIIHSDVTGGSVLESGYFFGKDSQ